MLEIESYEFGRIVVDGREYTNDLFIFADGVSSEWWRDEGHVLQPQDLEEVMDKRPELLVIGQGHSSRMKVPERTKTFLHEEDIDFEALNTQKAWRRFNELQDEGKDVAAALHLTC